MIARIRGADTGRRPRAALTGRWPRAALALVAGTVVTLAPAARPSAAQEADRIAELERQVERLSESMRHELDVVQRQVDDLMFFTRLGDVADIDLVEMTGPPLRYEPNPTAQGPAIRSGSTPTCSSRRISTARARTRSSCSRTEASIPTSGRAT